MKSLTGRMLLGFIAAAISVLVVHQTIIFGLGQIGMTRSVPWTLRPIGYGPVPWLPLLANSVFWGGMWGALFGALYHALPGGVSWLKGLIFGILVLFVSNWTLLPLIREHLFGVPRQVLFAGFTGANPMVLLPGILILSGFGLGLGIVYGLIARRAA